MATVTITHQKVSIGTVNAEVEVDGHDWNNTHTVAGLENVDNTSDAAKIAALTAITVVTASGAIAAGTSAIAIQKIAPSTTALSLPTVAAQAGKPIHIIDWSTSVTDHAITMTPNGTEKIMLAATWTINSNTVQLASITLYPSTVLNGWYIAP